MRSGSGGAGAVSFRRERYVPRGGPDGGHGGRGGDVFIVAETALSTLLDHRYKKSYIAQNGRPGGGKDCTGADGQSCTIRVPVGTQVYDTENGQLLVDLIEDGQRYVLARGGLGGKGNAHFANASRRSPEYAQPGRPGEELHIRLELKLLADVGLIGFPNAGKSTLISRLSRAKPKVASYPFTTLTPNLGVVGVDIDRSYVVADMPGLIEGAAEGAGLGHRFLKHIERTGLFLYLVTQDMDPERDPINDLKILRDELHRYDPSLSERPYLVAMSQCDRPEVLEQLDELKAAVEPGTEVIAISAVSGFGLDQLQSKW